MRILIVDCLSAGNGKRKFSRDFIGGGPKVIAGVLSQIKTLKAEIEIIRAEDIINPAESPDLNKLKSFDLCLISAMSMDLACVKKISTFWKKVKKNKMIILGGPISSDIQILEKVHADISIKGEGEEILLQIVNLLINSNNEMNNEICPHLRKIKGISFRFNGNIFSTGDKDPLSKEAFNKFTKPGLFINFYQFYKNYKAARIYVECLRGCSNFYRASDYYKSNGPCLKTCKVCRDEILKNRINCPRNIPPGCGFCSTIGSFGSPKSRNMELIISEIKALLKIGARRIVLGGPDLLDYKREDLVPEGILTTPEMPPLPNYHALNDLVENIINIDKVKQKEAQIFVENVKASLCTKEALKILSRIPNSVFSIGCETGSDEFAKKLGRPCFPEQILKAIVEAIKFGIRLHVYFIHSLLGEIVEYIMESIELLNKLYDLGVEKITIYKYREFPGSPFYNLNYYHKTTSKETKLLERYRKKLIKQAINFNLERKREMIGKDFDVILAEQNFINKEDAIGYILQGGPKVLVKKGNIMMGALVKARINKVISDKLVEGFIL